METTYTVVTTGSMFDDHSDPMGKADAIATARAWAKAGTGNVFIAFYRASDGQKGYLNPNGDHSPTGEPWN